MNMKFVCLSALVHNCFKIILLSSFFPSNLRTSWEVASLPECVRAIVLRVEGGAGPTVVVK